MGQPFTFQMGMAPMKSMKAMKAPKAMKAMKAAAKPAAKGTKPITKGGIAEILATEGELKKSVCSKIINSLAEIAATEVKKTGKFVIPGVCMIKTRKKPATKAGKRMAFGQEVFVKAKPARTVVKAFPVAALKKSI